MTERPLGKEHHCDECGDDVDTLLPRRLIEDTHKGKVLLFVGSGASTEAHNVMAGFSFYNDIPSRVSVTNGELAFPDPISRYVARFCASSLLIAFVNRQRTSTAIPSFMLARPPFTP